MTVMGAALLLSWNWPRHACPTLFFDYPSFHVQIFSHPAARAVSASVTDLQAHAGCKQKQLAALAEGGNAQSI